MALPKIVSLFSGAGGLDLGFHEAGFPVVFAVDSSAAAIKTHKRNFPATTSIAADLVGLGPGGVLNYLGNLLMAGEPIGVIGGPPCQGFSRANTGSVAKDPRNKLPLLCTRSSLPSLSKSAVVTAPSYAPLVPAA